MVGPINTPENSAQGEARLKRNIQVQNTLGLHLRPASKLVKLASSFEGCEITLEKDGDKVNAKSIMGVIMLAAEQGTVLVIEAYGTNCADAVDAIEALFDRRFDEE